MGKGQHTGYLRVQKEEERVCYGLCDRLPLVAARRVAEGMEISACPWRSERLAISAKRHIRV
jgi:hypothetical protein